MTIDGLQKLSLLDYPDRTCCTVFTRGCNFRCPYCHNPKLVMMTRMAPLVPDGEVFAFLEKRKGLLDGVCVSGGEPLLQPDIADFLGKVKALGYLVKLDTNGSSPEKLRALAGAGLLDYVAMDIKSAPESYGRAAGLEHFDAAPILESARFLMEGTLGFEFRTTVARPLHTEADFAAIAGWLAGAPRYYLQGFVDSGDILGAGLSAFSPEEMAHFLDILRAKIPAAQLRGA